MSVGPLLQAAHERYSQFDMRESHDIQGCKDRLHSSNPFSNLYHRGWIRTMHYKKTLKHFTTIESQAGIDRMCIHNLLQLVSEVPQY